MMLAEGKGQRAGGWVGRQLELNGALDGFEAAKTVRYVQRLKNQREGGIPAAHALHRRLQMQKAALLRHDVRMCRLQVFAIVKTTVKRYKECTENALSE